MEKPLAVGSQSSPRIKFIVARVVKYKLLSVLVSLWLYIYYSKIVIATKSLRHEKVFLSGDFVYWQLKVGGITGSSRSKVILRIKFIVARVVMDNFLSDSTPADKFVSLWLFFHYSVQTNAKVHLKKADCRKELHCYLQPIKSTP